MDGTMTWTAEFDLTPEQAAALLGTGLLGTGQSGELRRYCDATGDYTLWIGKLGGAFRITMMAPDYTAQRDATTAMLLAWIDGGWINMDVAMLADLRTWALGEVAA